MRKSYGNTWWGKQWLNALNQIDYSNRLPRGRRYANNGSVLEVEIDGNQIRAAVQGSRPRPYSVDLTIPPFSASEKAKLLEIITSNPLFLSQLLNRELPEGLYGAALKQGIHLFPRQWGDLSGGCSCPDWAVPCKHMAAVLYLVANEIDKNPFLVFDLHRFDLFQGLAGIGYTAAVEQAVQIPAVSSTRGLAASMAVPAAASWDESVLEEVDLSQVPDCLDQIFTLLKEQPVFFPTGDFKKVMATVYKKIRRSMTRLRKQADTQTIPPKVWLVEQAELVLANEGTFWQCELWDAQGDRIAYFEDEEELMDLLRAIPLGQVGALAPDLGSLVLCYHLAEKLLLQCAYVPQLFEVGETEYWIRWQAATFNGAVGRLFNTIKSLIPADLVRFDTDEAAEKPYPSEVLPTLMGFFLSHFIHTYHDMDLDQQLSTVTRLFFKDTTEVFDSFEEREYPGAIQVWLSRFYIAEKDFVPVLQVEDKNGVFVIRLSIDDKSKPMEAPLPLRALF
ncbi:MAG: SWIM zinc finger family protein, partial [Bacteroidota bacterium]